MTPDLYTHLLPLLNALSVVTIATLVVLLVMALWIFHNSKKWHGIGAAQHVEKLNTEVAAVRGNFESFKRDTNERLTDIQDCNFQILKQLEGIKNNGEKESLLDSRVRMLRDEMADTAQALRSLPCFIDKNLHSKLMEAVTKNKEKS